MTGPERTEGPATEAALGLPVGVATGMDSVVYISDEVAHRVYRVGAYGMMTTFAGTGEAGYSGDGVPATGAQLSEPNGLATDPRGNVYIADLGNNVVRVVDAKGVIRTVAGTGSAGSGGDGRRATKAQLNDPFAVALDHSGACTSPTATTAASVESTQRGRSRQSSLERRYIVIIIRGR